MTLVLGSQTTSHQKSRLLKRKGSDRIIVKSSASSVRPNPTERFNKVLGDSNVEPPTTKLTIVRSLPMILLPDNLQKDQISLNLDFLKLPYKNRICQRQCYCPKNKSSLTCDIVLLYLKNFRCLILGMQLSPHSRTSDNYSF